MKYCGIGLHSNNSVVIVSDEEDRIVFSKRLPNDLGQIGAALESHREDLAGVVIESTYNWDWLVDGLMAIGYQVHLAHPSAIKKYEGLKHSGDFADAAYLAHLLRLGLLAEGYIYPREERGARDLARKRMQLVRYRTAQILDRGHPDAADGSSDEGRGGQTADGRAGRCVRLCAGCFARGGGQPCGQPDVVATDRSAGVVMPWSSPRRRASCGRRSAAGSATARGSGSVLRACSTRT
ncbi:MAG TPA: transposase [Casimicrobiaceae bacterium]